MKRILYLFCFIVCFAIFSPSVHAQTLQDNETFYRTQIFPDVPPSASYYKAVQWAYHNNILSGSNGKFLPHNSLTERQFVKMYANFFQFPEVSYTVTSNEAWDVPFYEKVHALGAPIKGYNSRNVRNANINRGTLAQLIAFAHGQPSDVNSAVTYLMDTGISTGQNPSETIPINKFGATNSLQRQQAVQFLYRMFLNKQDTLNKNIIVDKNYFVGGGVYYKVTNATPQAYEVAIIANGKQIGGYVSKVGATIGNHKVGATATNTIKGYSKDNRFIYPLVDTIDCKISSIYWEDSSKEAQNYFAAMGKDASALKSSNLAQIAFDLTNNSRVNKGLRTLSYDFTLAHVAESHSTDMVTNNFWSHTNLSNLKASDRYKKAGIVYREMAENLAQAPSVFETQVSLMNSSSHRTTILNANLTYVGIGLAYKNVGNYYQIFTTYNYIKY